jgi:fused signal recognition particle receptor
MAERASWSLGAALRGVFGAKTIDEDTWDDLESALIRADFGPAVTEEIVDSIKAQVDRYKTTDPRDVQRMLREMIEERLAKYDPTLKLTERPAVVLVVGVNGVGKTTTIGKFARFLRAYDRSVIVGAADTFRAAAVEQLTGWAERAGCDIIKPDREGADPGSVAFEAVRRGREMGVDVVIIDTAGRLHTQDALMAELGKIRRVISKQLPEAPHETLLTVDATTGQNGLRQAKLFSEVVPVDGIVLTKLDGTAKGGIALAISGELGIPVKLIGIGEQLDDLRPFDADDFARALLS